MTTKIAKQTYTQDLRPSYDITEEGNAFLIAIEMPGVPKEAINLEATAKKLLVSGSTVLANPGEGWKEVAKAIPSGSYKLDLQFRSEISPEQIEANYELGVLKIRVQKAEASTVRKIAIK